MDRGQAHYGVKVTGLQGNSTQIGTQLQSAFVLPQIERKEKKDAYAPTRFSDVMAQRHNASGNQHKKGKAHTSNNWGGLMRDVQEMYRVITGDDVVSDKDVAAFMKMESEIQAYFRSYGRDQLYTLVVRQTLLDKVGAAASELLHRRLQSTEAHVKTEEKPGVSNDPVVANVQLSIRAAKRLLEMDRLLKTSNESDVSSRQIQWMREQLLPILQNLCQRLTAALEEQSTSEGGPVLVSPAVAVARALDEPLVAAMGDTVQRTQAALECLDSQRQQEWLPGALMVFQGLVTAASEAVAARTRGQRQLVAAFAARETAEREAAEAAAAAKRAADELAADLREQLALHREGAVGMRRQLEGQLEAAQAENARLRDMAMQMERQMAQVAGAKPTGVCEVCSNR
eukprot:CAMPEP_0118929054 /NCGR_PEP_ID=MMETSP1169-20130426/6163_1 /TAXON_ID=36882 /ORGANISM="Pyramimonas obovata, Strain CCMP722" /LENGTH=398 /DNA_ID=CAMNT_0006871173 /DNA_START=288 /DNA_END=1481 /DNA_ORIENTATION=+